MSNRILVVPTNRPESLKAFFAAWEGRGGWDAAYVIEDGPERTFELPDSAIPFVHFAWRDLERLAGDAAWIFSRRDSAIRCFGFLAAYHAGAEYVLTLDDDTAPPGGADFFGANLGCMDFFGAHLACMSEHRRWVGTVPGLRVRGLPYKNLGTLTGVVANAGLWTHHPDLDAITSLAHVAQNSSPSYALLHANWIVPRGQYAPICGMNLSIARCALPLFYFPLMGQGQRFSRFDDIWAGVIAKKICDHLGWSISVGEPFVEHRRASDPFVNLVKESPGIAANEDFWVAVDGIRLTAHSPAGCVAELGEGLRRDADPYRAQLGAALQVWARLFERPPPGLA